MKKNNLKYIGQSNGGGANITAEAEVTTAPATGKRTRILIVEDEPAMVAGLRDNFEYEGYEVISAADGSVWMQADPAHAGPPQAVGASEAGRRLWAPA